MRISGGRARGVRLKVPPGARPAAERVRQAIFSSLAERVEDARVLDLYCGSGAYALESLSRGAASAVGVDNDARAVKLAAANAQAAGLDGQASFLKRDAVAFAGPEARRKGPFDLVFCDRPYEEAGSGELLARLRPALAADATVVVEQRWGPGAGPVADGYVLVADRRYGDTRILTYRGTGDAGR